MSCSIEILFFSKSWNSFSPKELFPSFSRIVLFFLEGWFYFSPGIISFLLSYNSVVPRRLNSISRLELFPSFSRIFLFFLARFYFSPKKIFPSFSRIFLFFLARFYFSPGIVSFLFSNISLLPRSILFLAGDYFLPPPNISLLPRMLILFLAPRNIPLRLCSQRHGRTLRTLRTLRIECVHFESYSQIGIAHHITRFAKSRLALFIIIYKKERMSPKLSSQIEFFICSLKNASIESYFIMSWKRL